MGLHTSMGGTAKRMLLQSASNRTAMRTPKILFPHHMDVHEWTDQQGRVQRSVRTMSTRKSILLVEIVEEVEGGKKISEHWHLHGICYVLPCMRVTHIPVCATCSGATPGDSRAVGANGGRGTAKSGVLHIHVQCVNAYMGTVLRNGWKV